MTWRNIKMVTVIVATVFGIIPLFHCGMNQQSRDMFLKRNSSRNLSQVTHATNESAYPLEPHSELYSNFPATLESYAIVPLNSSASYKSSEIRHLPERKKGRFKDRVSSHVNNLSNQTNESYSTNKSPKRFMNKSDFDRGAIVFEYDGDLHRRNSYDGRMKSNHHYDDVMYQQYNGQQDKFSDSHDQPGDYPHPHEEDNYDMENGDSGNDNESERFHQRWRLQQHRNKYHEMEQNTAENNENHQNNKPIYDGYEIIHPNTSTYHHQYSPSYFQNLSGPNGGQSHRNKEKQNYYIDTQYYVDPPRYTTTSAPDYGGQGISEAEFASTLADIFGPPKTTEKPIIINHHYTVITTNEKTRTRPKKVKRQKGFLRFPVRRPSKLKQWQTIIRNRFKNHLEQRKKHYEEKYTGTVEQGRSVVDSIVQTAMFPGAFFAFSMIFMDILQRLMPVPGFPGLPSVFSWGKTTTTTTPAPKITKYEYTPPKIPTVHDLLEGLGSKLEKFKLKKAFKKKKKWIDSSEEDNKWRQLPLSRGKKKRKKKSGKRGKQPRLSFKRLQELYSQYRPEYNG